MSPYFTAGFGFGKGSEEQMWTNVFYSDPQDLTSALTFMDGASVKATGGYSTFSWGLGAGFDYYVADNLYLGLEMNLNTVTVNNDPTNVTVDTATPWRCFTKYSWKLICDPALPAAQSSASVIMVRTLSFVIGARCRPSPQA